MVEGEEIDELLHEVGTSKMIAPSSTLATLRAQSPPRLTREVELSQRRTETPKLLRIHKVDLI